MWRLLAEVAREAVGLIYPPACLICDTLVPGADALRHGLCTTCYHAVTMDSLPCCPRCAQSVGPHADTANGCVECRGENLGFERAVRLGPYAGKLRDAVLRMKFLAGESLADMMGRIFVECHRKALDALEVDAVAPLPLHWWRRWRRGYNQSESVARELALGLSVSFEPRLLRRVRHTAQQGQPSRSARQANMKGAFRVGRGASLGGQTILLVDDVMTTCATTSEAAKTLLAGGAERVVVAVLARR